MSPAPLLYGLAAAILAAEATVFGLALFPNVDPAYRAFYIDRTTDCYPLPVTGDYQLGSTLDFSDPARALRARVARCGWRDPAQHGSWTDGQLSMLRFRLDPALVSDLVLTLDLHPYLHGPLQTQLVELTANGIALAPLTLRERKRSTVQLLVPAAAVAAGQGILDLELRFPNARSPYDLGLSPSDKRIYALFVYSLRLAPI